LVSPLIPHLSEEFWKMLGGKKFVFQEGLPRFERVDEKTILGEEYIKSLIEDIRQVRKLVEGVPKEVDIIVAAKWKFDLAKKIIRGEKIELKSLLENFEPKEKEIVAKFYRKIERERESLKILSRSEEVKLIEEAREILEKETKAKIIITFEERSGLEKAKKAEPFKPAIYFSI
jgi:leucyl-tRNA synthetase